MLLGGGEKIGETDSFEKSMVVGDEILDTIKKYPNKEDPDEYATLQIRCFHWISRLFGTKGVHGGPRYELVVWSKKKEKYVVSKL